mgnify:CR=1 FL=1
MGGILQEHQGLVLLVLILGPFLLYWMVRIISSAWYRSKLDFLRRFTNDADQKRRED